jgi:hypothetical protein
MITMPEPKRWPNNANESRIAALDAAKQTIECVINLVAAVAVNDIPAALRAAKRIHQLQVYIERTLIAAKYGESPEPMPEGVFDEP